MNFPQSLVGFGLASGLTVVGAAWPAQAQSPIVSGDPLSFSAAQIFVGGANPAVVYQGNVPDNANNFSVLVQIQQSDLTLNGIYRSAFLPQIGTGALPVVGDTGITNGELTFLGFGSSGQWVLGLNVPIDLQFQVTSINPVATGAINEFRSPSITVTESVLVNNSFTVSQTRDVIFVEYGATPSGAFPVAQTTLGASFNAPFTANITGGSVLIPQTGLFDTGTATLPGVDSNSLASQLQRLDRVQISRSSETVSTFQIFGTVPNGAIGAAQRTPALPTRTVRRGVFVFTQIISGIWYDPPMAESYEFTMTPSPQPLGLQGRVFPGMQATELRDESVFTAITGLPDGIDADNRFTVTVGEVVLGEFSPADAVQFADYAEQLGDLLIGGEGVKNFTISGIEPGVDPDNPLAFPVRLEFNTPTASFEMAAQGEDLDENVSASVYSDETMSTRQDNQARLAAIRQGITAEVVSSDTVVQQSPSPESVDLSLLSEQQVGVSRFTTVE